MPLVVLDTSALLFYYEVKEEDASKLLLTLKSLNDSFVVLPAIWEEFSRKRKGVIQKQLVNQAILTGELKRYLDAIKGYHFAYPEAYRIYETLNREKNTFQAVADNHKSRISSLRHSEDDQYYSFISSKIRDLNLDNNTFEVELTKKYKSLRESNVMIPGSRDKGELPNDFKIVNELFELGKLESRDIDFYTLDVKEDWFDYSSIEFEHGNPWARSQFNEITAKNLSIKQLYQLHYFSGFTKSNLELDAFISLNMVSQWGPVKLEIPKGFLDRISSIEDLKELLGLIQAYDREYRRARGMEIGYIRTYVSDPGESRLLAQKQHVKRACDKLYDYREAFNQIINKYR